VKVEVDDSHAVWIGGNVATCISGEVDIKNLAN
jgi:hypothetical protein